MTTVAASVTTATDSAPARANIKTRNRGRPNDTPILSDSNPLEIFVDHEGKHVEIPDTTELAIASPTNVLHSVNSAVPGVTTLHSKQTLRSLEATAIRRKLSRHDDLHHASMRKKNKKRSTKHTANGDQSSPDDSNDDGKPKPWNVAHFPIKITN